MLLGHSLDQWLGLLTLPIGIIIFVLYDYYIGYNDDLVIRKNLKKH